jgi:hypothetical protein
MIGLPEAVRIVVRAKERARGGEAARPSPGAEQLPENCPQRPEIVYLPCGRDPVEREALQERVFRVARGMSVGILGDKFRRR